MSNPVNLRSFFYRLQCLLVGLSVLGLSINPVAVYAQGADIDIELPDIDHQQGSGQPGQPQTIVAIVEDNLEVASVTLYYRFDPRQGYLAVPMTATGQGSRYEATVATAGQKASSFQYYIRAVDSSGNSRFRGFNFSPLTWLLQGAGQQASTADSAPVSSPQSGTNDAAVPKSNRTLYTVLGVVAALALAGLAASGGGGGGSAEPCSDTGCTLTITGRPPASQ